MFKTLNDIHAAILKQKMLEADEKTLQSESLKPLLEHLLSSKSDRLVIKANDKGKNRLMWSHFDIAYLDGKEQQYACCKYCKGFVKYTGRTGTGGLMRHFCYKQILSHQEEKETPVHQPPQHHSPEPKPSSSEPEKLPLRLQIETLIAQKSPRIGYIYNHKGKSGVWSQFYMITLDNAIVNFACCIACHGIVTYVSRTGTGSMTRHKCQNNSAYKKYIKTLEGGDVRPLVGKKRKFSIEGSDVDEDDVESLRIKTEDDWELRKIKEEGQDECSERLEEENNSETGFSEEDRISPEMEKLIREKHFALIKRSFSLLDMFHNEEFLDFAQTLVCLGAQYGNIDLRKIINSGQDLTEFLRKSRD